MQVRFAKAYNFIRAGEGPGDNRVLFFLSAPTTATVEQIQTLFEQFGTVESINLFRERRSGRSKGCGFLTMQTRDQAATARDSLDETLLLEVRVCCVVVGWGALEPHWLSRGRSCYAQTYHSGPHASSRDRGARGPAVQQRRH